MITCWCFWISPRVSLSVVEVEPDQAQLILKLPQVRAGLSFAHQVLMSPLWRNHSYGININANPTLVQDVLTTQNRPNDQKTGEDSLVFIIKTGLNGQKTSFIFRCICKYNSFSL